MPNPARLVVYGVDNKPLSGSVPVEDSENADLTGSEIHEFSHQVYTIEKDYFYSLLYGVDFVRQHKPLSIVKKVDKMSVPLRSLLLKGTFIPKVEIRWYTYLEDFLNLQEYFRMTMEHVRLHNMRMILPDVKEPDLEQYDHLENITFCYQKITWLHTKGHLLFTDIWNDGFFAEEDEKDFGEKKDDELDQGEDILEIEDALKVTFTSGTFDIAPEDVAFDKKSKVTFIATYSRETNMNERKVYAKLFAVCDGKTEDLRQTQEGRLSETGEWTTTFTLKKPEMLADSEGAEKQVEYYAEIENKYADGNFKSESIKTPSGEHTIYLYGEDDEPLAGVEVELRLDGEVVKEYTSDADGKVTVEFDSGDGEYRLHLKGDGPDASSETDESEVSTTDEAQEPAQDEVSAAEQVPDAPKENESVLHVVDQDEKPLEGVSFTIIKNKEAVGTVVTDSEGNAVVVMDSVGDEYEFVFDKEKNESAGA